MEGSIVYLLVHGIATVGAVIGFMVRSERRITWIETTLLELKRQHDIYTSPKAGHGQCVGPTT